LNTRGYHPTARCSEANNLYWQWVHVPEDLIYRADFQDAKARYQLHLWECAVCREVLDAKIELNARS